MLKVATGFLALSLVATVPAFAQTAAPSAPASPQGAISNTVKPETDKAKSTVNDAAGKVEQKATQAKDKAVEAKAPAAHALIDINTASATELASLHGIGPVRAEAIIKGRPYHGKDDLVSKKIISQSVYDAVKDQIIAKQK